jgi:1-deoxy-D-xylulose-5-phosphate reductoisomerase
MPRRIAIVGSTGTIGVNCLDVVDHLPDRLKVAGISGHANTRLLVEQARKHRPDWVAVTDKTAAAELDRSALPGGCELVVGPEALARKVAGAGHNLVVSAIVGAAGLDSTWAALEAGKDVAVANKETLVLAGALVLDLAKRKGAKLLPVDSEHSALFQLLQEPGALDRVEKLVLTGSGGPFRGKKRQDLAHVTVDQALAHPTWRMGKKITIDSATLMNKALELIEARWLFDMPVAKLDAIIHPESVIHSFVEFVDGSVVAQASPPDMRLPIQYALTWPDRVPGPTRRLDWRALSKWSFEQPDREAFPALDLGLSVAQAGGTAGAVLNAANEVAVERFLAGKLSFLDITRLVSEVVGAHTHDASPGLEELRHADRWARQEARIWQSKLTTTAH